jgi:hypothetical protein
MEPEDWGFMSSEMSCWVTGLVSPDILKEHNAFTLKFRWVQEAETLLRYSHDFFIGPCLDPDKPSPYLYTISLSSN